MPSPNRKPRSSTEIFASDRGVNSPFRYTSGSPATPAFMAWPVSVCVVGHGTTARAAAPRWWWRVESAIGKANGAAAWTEKLSQAAAPCEGLLEPETDGVER